MDLNTTEQDWMTPVVVTVILLFTLFLAVSSAPANAAAIVICGGLVAGARSKHVDAFWWLLPAAIGALLVVTLVVRLI